MRLFLFAALCVLCCDCWFCFALCERIFDCGLRSFAPAGATSPFQSQRAGPQRCLVLVRVWWCCAFHKQNAKYPLRGRLTCSLRISKATACPNPTTLGISYRGIPAGVPRTWCAAHSIAVGDFAAVSAKTAASFFFPYLTKVKLSKRKICASQRLSQISFIAVLSSPSITTLANAGMHIRSMPIGAR